MLFAFTVRFNVNKIGEEVGAISIRLDPNKESSRLARYTITPMNDGENNPLLVAINRNDNSPGPIIMTQSGNPNCKNLIHIDDNICHMDITYAKYNGEIPDMLICDVYTK